MIDIDISCLRNLEVSKDYQILFYKKNNNDYLTIVINTVNMLFLFIINVNKIKNRKYMRNVHISFKTIIYFKLFVFRDLKKHENNIFRVIFFKLRHQIF